MDAIQTFTLNTNSSCISTILVIIQICPFQIEYIREKLNNDNITSENMC